MLAEDRIVTDDEILRLYKVADLAWCCYAPDYDQASGVFGRALQTGVEPVVREGRVLSDIKSLNLSTVEVSKHSICGSTNPSAALKNESVAEG